MVTFKGSFRCSYTPHSVAPEREADNGSAWVEVCAMQARGSGQGLGEVPGIDMPLIYGEGSAWDRRR